MFFHCVQKHLGLHLNQSLAKCLYLFLSNMLASVQHFIRRYGQFVLTCRDFYYCYHVSRFFKKHLSIYLGQCVGNCLFLLLKKPVSLCVKKKK